MVVLMPLVLKLFFHLGLIKRVSQILGVILEFDVVLTLDVNGVVRLILFFFLSLRKNVSHASLMINIWTLVLASSKV